MTLIIPAIDIKNGKCVQRVQGEPGAENIYSDDPVQAAILWRGENFKALHVSVLDETFDEKVNSQLAIKQMVVAVDIPIVVSASVIANNQVKELLDLGVYRVVVSSTAAQHFLSFKRLVDDFGPRRIVVAIDATNSRLRADGLPDDDVSRVVSVAMDLKNFGIQRILYVVSDDVPIPDPNFYAAKEIAIRSGLRVTVSGGIAGARDLWRMQELETCGVDSAIIRKALYENSFPCQKVWRLNEKWLADLGPTRRK
jgi:phosphoribosylformimino-5-aminoimidazole carboxamide ribotide isomerase